MHMGETRGTGSNRPFAVFDDGRRDGAINADGTVLGCYVHGLLSDPEQRRALLSRIGIEGLGRDYHASVDQALDEIAALLEEHLEMDALIDLAKGAAS
jgi:adenosylcobyric acid synthase